MCFQYNLGINIELEIIYVFWIRPGPKNSAGNRTCFWIRLGPKRELGIIRLFSVQPGPKNRAWNYIWSDQYDLGLKMEFGIIRVFWIWPGPKNFELFQPRSGRPARPLRGKRRGCWVCEVGGKNGDAAFRNPGPLQAYDRTKNGIVCFSLVSLS